MQQVKTFLNQLKITLVESKKTLAPFKWSIGFYVLFLMYAYFNYLYPCPKNYFIWNGKIWYHYTPELYQAGMELALLILILILFLALSNIKNHPRLARLILLSPWILLGLGLIKMLIYWLFSWDMGY